MREARSSVCLEEYLAHLWMGWKLSLTLICVDTSNRPWIRLRYWQRKGSRIGVSNNSEWGAYAHWE